MRINTHGYKMHGLREAAEETKYLRGYGRYVQISYNRRTGEVLVDYHCDDGWTVYRDADIVTVHNACIPMTMQDVADAIAQGLADMAK